MPSKPVRQYSYISFNKPFGVLSQFTSEGGHPALDSFDLPKNVYAAGRLDRDSEGLLLLSDDGTFINKLINPKFSHPRTYWVQVEGIPDRSALEKLRNGPVIKGYKTKKCKVALFADPPSVEERIPPIRYRKSIPTSWLELTLTEGKNRQVRKMTAAIGHPTLRLLRVSIGELKLEGLAPGEWRKVAKGDILHK
ncbi:MAG: pseudouridine synthase [Sneathiellales bacterium]|nr:pseudouridine synthase [Sneathiellales bacterium]